MRQLFSGDYPELVLFDLDGTLIDSVPDLSEAVDRMLLSLGKPAAGIEQVQRWVGNGAAVLVGRALSGAMEPVDEKHELFADAYRSFLEYYAQTEAQPEQLYAGVLSCLQHLFERGVKLGLVTNKPIRFTREILEETGLVTFFNVVVGGDSFAEKKPHPLPLIEAMRTVGVGPEQTLMVGDSVSDVRAARAAGCAVACVPYGYNHGNDIALADPDLIVERLDELI